MPITMQTIGQLYQGLKTKVKRAGLTVAGGIAVFTAGSYAKGCVEITRPPSRPMEFKGLEDTINFLSHNTAYLAGEYPTVLIGAGAAIIAYAHFRKKADKGAY